MKKIQSALAPMKLAIQGFRIKGDVITARLSLEKKCLVTLSIPYSDGFRAEVNGEKVPLIRVNQMMLGYYASPGDQKLSIYYEPPGMRIGFYLSLLGILLTIILGIIYGICNERDKEHEGGFQNGVQ